MVKKVVQFVICIFVVSNFSYADTLGDVDQDNKVGLSEAVYALQVTSGLKLSQAAEPTSDYALNTVLMSVEGIEPLDEYVEIDLPTDVPADAKAVYLCTYVLYGVSTYSGSPYEFGMKIMDTTGQYKRSSRGIAVNSGSTPLYSYVWFPVTSDRKIKYFIYGDQSTTPNWTEVVRANIKLLAWTK